MKYLIQSKKINLATLFDAFSFQEEDLCRSVRLRRANRHNAQRPTATLLSTFSFNFRVLCMRYGSFDIYIEEKIDTPATQIVTREQNNVILSNTLSLKISKCHKNF